MVGIITLFVVLALGLLITRIATVALTFTGLSKDLARFQARSAFTACGFTTKESESIAEHPVRRRIIMVLMLMGNSTVVLAISALTPVFINTGGSLHDFLNRVLWLALGLVVLWLVSASNAVDRQLSRIIGWALKRWSRLEVWDYPSLLNLSEGYTVGEMKVEAGDWVAGKNLAELRLADEGVAVLGIRRADDEYIGVPTGHTFIRRGDTLVLYGRSDQLVELEGRRADATGDIAHTQRVREQATVLARQAARDVRESRVQPPDAD